MIRRIPLISLSRQSSRFSPRFILLCHEKIYTICTIFQNSVLYLLRPYFTSWMLNLIYIASKCFYEQKQDWSVMVVVCRRRRRLRGRIGWSSTSFGTSPTRPARLGWVFMCFLGESLSSLLGTNIKSVGE